MYKERVDCEVISVQEQIETHTQQERLTIYRRALAHWLQQAAQHGAKRSPCLRLSMAFTRHARTVATSSRSYVHLA
jgi:hypothetical protein